MKMDILKITGTKFLRCGQQDCQWNIGWLGGFDWTEETGKGIRICNLGAGAMLKANAVPPDDCQQASAVLKLAHGEFEF